LSLWMASRTDIFIPCAVKKSHEVTLDANGKD
jgi:hypothetical protein